METDEDLDCVISDSSMTNNAQETPSAASYEECLGLDTTVKQTPAVKRITPLPPLAADAVAQRAGWSLSDDDDDDDDLSGRESDCHVAWYAEKIAAPSHLSPTVIDLCSNDSELDTSDNEYDPLSGKGKAKDVKHAPKDAKPAPWLNRFDNYSDTSDNEYDPVGGKRKAKQAEKVPWLKKIKKKEPVRPLAKLSAVEEKGVLNKIESSADRALMRLLWKIGFRYTLMAHQFEGVRAVAGVPSFFPFASETGDEAVLLPSGQRKYFNPFQLSCKRGVCCWRMKWASEKLCRALGQ